MKKIGFIFIICLLTALPQSTANMESRSPATAVIPDQAPPLGKGDTAVDFSLYDFYDNSTVYNLDAFDGQVLLLDLMASWCGPCRESTPEMNRLYNVFKSTGEVAFLSIAVDTDEADSSLVNFHDTYGVVWNFTRDYVGAIGAGSFSSVYGSGYIPTYYLVGTDGIIKKSQVGWAGIEDYFKEIKSLVNATDTEKPVFNEMTTEIDSFSIIDQSMMITVDATDNFGVKTVMGTAEVNGVSKTIEMTYDYETGKFQSIFKLDPAALYDADTVNFSFEMTDWYGNTQTKEGLTVPVEKITDDVAPEIVYSKATEVKENGLHYLDVTLSVRDIYVSDPVITETRSDGTTKTYLPQRSSSGALYKFYYQLNYTEGEVISQNDYKVTVTDLGGNSVNQTLNVDFLDGQTDSISDTPVSSNTSEEPVNLAFIIPGFVALILLRKEFWSKTISRL